jgi:hypothetical protein
MNVFYEKEERRGEERRGEKKKQKSNIYLHITSTSIPLNPKALSPSTATTFRFG